MANENQDQDDDVFDSHMLKVWRQSAAFRRASFHAPDEIWNLFSEADNCSDIIDYFRALIKVSNIDPSMHGIEFFNVLKSKLTSWKCQSLWDLLNTRLKLSEYKQGTAAKGLNCLIIGSGPIGLRMAIEALLLGCKTVVVEKRTEFSRNNVLHLWPFLMTDFRGLGAKKFYGKFGAGCIEHINIKTLQCVLLKIALILGLEVHFGVSFLNLVEPTDEKNGWRGNYEPENHEVSKFTFDIVIAADGKKNVLPGFPQIELRGALAIGITCNFINNNTVEEAGVAEISGISYQYNPTFFNDMEAEYGVKLENIVYYKDETHYFVMTALKSSLLNLGVFKEDISDSSKLLNSSNINKKKLIEFARYAVNHATNHKLPEDLEFKKLSNGNPDIALFDFTSIKKAANASRIIERKKHRLMVALVGDSLIEPFWPTGSGAGRGVLSALDVAWMIHQFAAKNPPLAVLRERENIFKLLSVTTNDSLQKNYKAFTIDPKTRYSGFDTKRVSNITSLKGLYDTDDQGNADFSIASPVSIEQKKKPAARRRTSSGGGARKTSSHVNLHTHVNKPKRKSDRVDLKDQATVGNTKKFWEEHNQNNFAEKAKSHVSKQKQKISVASTESGEELETLSDLEDDVIEDEPMIKKGFSKSKSVKHQKEDKKKGFFHAKGGGLKSKSMIDHIKKTPEKSDSRARKKSLSTKKSTGNVQGKRHHSTEGKDEPVKKKEPPRLVDPRSFFRKWLETFKEHTQSKSSDETPTENCPPALDTCIQTAAMTVMAIPLLMDCNRPPRRRTTDIRLKDVQAAKDTFLNPDTVKETQEISLKRAGSVKNTIQKYKMLVETEKSNDNYYDFLRRTSSANKSIRDQSDSVSIELEKKEFTPKEVIDVEKALLENEQEERQRSHLAKKTWSTSGKETDLMLRLRLEEFCDLQTPMNAVLLLQVLYNIHKRIQDEPDIDKYYRVYIKGEIFERYVWILEGSQKYLQTAGWIKCGNYMILSKSYPINQSVRVISDLLKKKKKAQVLHSGSVLNHGQHKRPDISLRRVRSNVGDSTINEDEILESYTNIEAPVQDTDSAIGSAFEDDDDAADYKTTKHRLRRVESKEHIVGNEEYIVVDFIGNLEVSSRRSSKVDSPTFTDTSKLAPQSPISNTSAFEELYSENDPEQQADDVNQISSDNDKKDSSDETPEQHVQAEKPVQEFPKEKRKVFSAGNGLKKTNVDVENEENLPSSDTDSVHSTTSIQSAPVKRVDSNGNAASRVRRSIKDPNNLERTSSQKSTSSDSGRPASLVMQHKLMFDQQISAGLKQKHGSTKSLESRRRTSNLGLSNFEKPKGGLSSSLNERRNNSRKSDVDVTGIVAASRGMFEQGNAGVSKSRVAMTTGATAGSDEKPTETYKLLTDVSNNTEVTPNPYLSNYQPKDHSSKKKKFPFKKQKAEKIKDADTDKKNSVELLSVKSTEKFEERAIDVPADVFNDGNEEVSEKKKKGLFSRIRKHRKSSSDSEHEHKHSLERKKKISSEKEIIHEQNLDESMHTEEISEENEHTGKLEIHLQDNSSYSSEAASVLENIMDRKASIVSNDSVKKKKKKKKFLKKISRSSPVDNSPVDNSPEPSDMVGSNEPDVASVQAISVELQGSQVNNSTELDLKEEIVANDKSANVIDNINEEENIQEIIRTDRLISDWSFDIEDALDENKEHTDLKQETIPEENHIINDDVETPQLELMNKNTVTNEIETVIPSTSDIVQNEEILAVEETSIQTSFESRDAVADVLSLEEDSGVGLDSTQNPSQPEIVSPIHPTVEVSEALDEEDELVDMLVAEAHTRGSFSVSQRTVSEADSISYDEQHEIESLNGSVLTMNDEKKKKKRRFKFLMKKKNKKDTSLNVSLPDGLDEHSSERSPTKKSSFKRPKSLENLVDLLPRKSKKSTGSRPNSMTEDDVNQSTPNGINENEHEKVGKTKKKLSFFKKKNKNDPPSPVKSPSKSPTVFYDDVKENLPSKSPNEDVKQTLVSSDEFTIPENGTNTTDERQTINNVGDEQNQASTEKTAYHKEFIKNQEILEVKTSESMEF